MRLALLIAGTLACCLRTCGPAVAGELSASDSVAALCPARASLAPLFAAAAERYRVPVTVLVAMARVESSCDPRAENARTRSYGLLQIKLDGSANDGRTQAELLAPEVSIELGAKHLSRWARLCGSLAGGLSVYSGRRHCRDHRGDGYTRRVLELVRWAKWKIQRLQTKRS